MENTLKKAGSLRVLNEPLIIFFPVKLSPRRHGYNWPVERLRANKISSPLLHLAISGWGWEWVGWGAPPSSCPLQLRLPALLQGDLPGGGSGDPGSGDALSQLRWVWGHLEDLTLHTSLSFLMFKIRGKGYINQQA